MEVITLKTDSLAHLSYVLISNGEAVVIDPRRDAEEYFDIIRKKGANLKFIFETHRNEDLVTGSRELHRYSEAPIYHGRGIDFKFGHYVDEGDKFHVGDVCLEVLETPGHTPESISIAVFPEGQTDKALGVFTGDALFVGDVGRTDFFPTRKEEFAGMLYDSLHEKLLSLGDQAVVYPAHGAGSVCGSDMADRDFSTIGYEKAKNPKLQLSRAEFIKEKVAEEHEMPPYFKEMERVNLQGDDPKLKTYRKMDFLEVNKLEKNKSHFQVIDTREPEAFLGSHIPDSICLPKSLVGSYAGYLLEYQKDICLVSDSLESAEEYCMELLRLGFDNFKFFLPGGVSSWATEGKPVGSFKTVDIREMKSIVSKKSALILDVRKPDEWKDGVIDGARTIFLGDLEAQRELPLNEDIVIYCGSGKRATVAASILQKKKISRTAVFAGSMAAWDSATSSQE